MDCIEFLKFELSKCKKNNDRLRGIFEKQVILNEELRLRILQKELQIENLKKIKGVFE